MIAGEKPFMCSICGKRYNDLATLKKHLATHDEVNANIIPPTTNEQGEVNIDELCKVRPVCEYVHLHLCMMKLFRTETSIRDFMKSYL